MKKKYLIDGWIVDSDLNRLIKSRVIKLEPKVMEVLICLIEHRGEVVSKDYLINTIWPDVIVVEQSLNRSVSIIRKALGDAPAKPKFIETISKKGYRFIYPVEEVERASKLSKKQEDVYFTESATQKNNLLKVGGLSLLVLFIFLIVMKIGFVNSPEKENPVTFASKLYPMTTFPGLESQVAFSPDDSAIVFSHRDTLTKRWNIFLKKGHKTSQITNTLDSEVHPRYSPDGRKIAFARITDNGGAIYILSLKDRKEQQILWQNSRRIYGLDWSGDNNIVYTERTATGKPPAIFLYSLSTEKKTQLTIPEKETLGDVWPKFSADGKSVAFVRTGRNGGSDIYKISISGENLKRITFDNEKIHGIDWSSKSGDIFYCVVIFEQLELRRVNQMGEVNSIQITTPLFSRLGYFPSLSNKEDKLAFQRWQVNADLFASEMNLADKKVSDGKGIFETSLYSDWNAEISPDGNKICFVSNRSGNSSIWVSDIDGKNLKKFTNMELYAFCRPKWSPDNKKLTFETYQNGSYNAYIIDLASNKVRPFEENALDPSFSGNGKYIYFSARHDGEWNVWKKDLNDGVAEQITFNLGNTPKESKTGEALFYTKERQPGVWRLDLLTKAEELIIPELRLVDRLNWEIVDKGIFYIKRTEIGPTIVFLSFENNHSKVMNTPLVSRKTPHINGLSVSHDKTKVVFTRRTQLESDIVYIELTN